jgi:hypothetical protein
MLFPTKNKNKFKTLILFQTLSRININNKIYYDNTGNIIFRVKAQESGYSK